MNTCIFLKILNVKIINIKNVNLCNNFNNKLKCLFLILIDQKCS